MGITSRPQSRKARARRAGQHPGTTHEQKIGVKLGLSESSVKIVAQRLFFKAAVKTRSQLVRVTLEDSWGRPNASPLAYDLGIPLRSGNGVLLPIVKNGQAWAWWGRQSRKRQFPTLGEVEAKQLLLMDNEIRRSLRRADCIGSGAVKTPHGRVRIVDDEPSFRRALRATLAALGFEVVEASSGEPALELAGADRCNVVLLEVDMPEMGGLEACRELRRRDPSLPIMMLTARDKEEDKVKAFEAGADDYVTKPFSVKELLARLRIAVPSLRRAVWRDLK